MTKIRFLLRPTDKCHLCSLIVVDDHRTAGAVVARVHRPRANVECIARSIRRPSLQRPSVHAALRFGFAFIVPGDGCWCHGLYSIALRLPCESCEQGSVAIYELLSSSIDPHNPNHHFDLQTCHINIGAATRLQGCDPIQSITSEE